jgi:transposase
LIKAANASLVYLPPYPPDLNPIEMAFAKLNALLPKAAARTRDILWDKIGDALRAFTPQQYANSFKHAGYAPRKVRPERRGRLPNRPKPFRKIKGKT